MNSFSAVFHSQSLKKYRQAMLLCLSISIALLAIFAILSALKIESASASTIRVGMIFDSPSFEDHGFNWQAYQGLVRAENELGVIGSVYTSTDPSEIEPQVQQCALDGNDLCIGVSFPLSDPISNTAASYPAIYFALVDAAYETYLPNVRGILFSSEQVGYLAGVLAASMSQSEIVGDLGGMQIPPVTAFTEGYRNGAQCADHDITTIISYTNDFGDPELGAQFAQGMITQGADVIFAVAGLSGNGAILTTTQSSVWAIGVDTDQYYSLFLSGTITGSNYLLSSAMKRTDNAIFSTISDVISNTFSSGTVVYDLASGAVELAPFHETEAYIPHDLPSRLNMFRVAIINGMIDPLDPEGVCLDFQRQYLPIAVR